jgi:hypothetical protein
MTTRGPEALDPDAATRCGATDPDTGSRCSLDAGHYHPAMSQHEFYRGDKLRARWTDPAEQEVTDDA